MSPISEFCHQHHCHRKNLLKEFNYQDDKWKKSMRDGIQKNVEENEWANDSIWPGYWRSQANFPISYDNMILKLLRFQNLRTPPCPNSPEENIMFVFHPYSTRTCRLRIRSLNYAAGLGVPSWNPLCRGYHIRLYHTCIVYMI